MKAILSLYCGWNGFFKFLIGSLAKSFFGLVFKHRFRNAAVQSFKAYLFSASYTVMGGILRHSQEVFTFPKVSRNGSSRCPDV